jgi:hypothetical protein
LNRAGSEARPVVVLLFLFGHDAKRDTSVERNGFKLDVETFGIAVNPRAADACPKTFAVFAVANVISDVAGRFGRGLVV